MSSSPYARTAQCLQQIWTTHKSLKTLAYDSKDGKLLISKSTYAQACHVLESKQILDQVVEAVGGISCRNEGLLYILLYELLLGPNLKIRGGGALKRQLMKQEDKLRSALQNVQTSDATNTAEAHVGFPRYVRINTLKTSMDEAVAVLQSQKQHNSVYADPHVPNLVVLPAEWTTVMSSHEMVKSGQLILQDKSSCFSALCLVHGNQYHPLQGDCLDACAAPGNKTSHLAMLLLSSSSSSSSTSSCGRITALDRSVVRLQSLERRMQQQLGPSASSRVVCRHLDFLQTKPQEWSKIRGILLDPSCSGSGIYSLDRRASSGSTSGDGGDDGKDAEKRIQRLADFQLKALLHAMQFPKAERIVYSTCSVHVLENESVVEKALLSNSRGWKLVAPHCLRHWGRRGQVTGTITADQAHCMIRANREDDTNGFFVAYFERMNPEKYPTQNKASTKSASISPPPAPPSGLAYYCGEFKGGTRKEESTKSHKAESRRKEEQKVVGKKKAKKLAWKQRQKELKQARLIRKKKGNVQTK